MRKRKFLGAVSIPGRGPIERGAVVKLRFGRNGELTNRKGIVMRNAPESAYTRAYGREVLVCVVDKKYAPEIESKNTTMVYRIGKVRRIPVECLNELKHYKIAKGLKGARRRKK